MGLYDNPSADKFKPPPTSRPPDPPGTKPERSRALAGAAFVLVAAREGLRFAHLRVSGYTWLAPLGFLALSIASFVVDRKRRAEIGRDNPYTAAQYVTR
jgi:hypothetical protein